LGRPDSSDGARLKMGGGRGGGGGGDDDAGGGGGGGGGGRGVATRGRRAMDGARVRECGEAAGGRVARYPAYLRSGCVRSGRPPKKLQLSKSRYRATIAKAPARRCPSSGPRRRRRARN
jgi:hypothetical protein